MTNSQYSVSKYWLWNLFQTSNFFNLKSWLQKLMHKAQNLNCKALFCLYLSYYNMLGICHNSWQKATGVNGAQRETLDVKSPPQKLSAAQICLLEEMKYWPQFSSTKKATKLFNILLRPKFAITIIF